MRRAFKHRIYPSEEQEQLLNNQIEGSTSRKYSSCGWIKEGPALEGRILECGDRSLKINRDIDTATDILKIGLSRPPGRFEYGR